jgi:hypothetical protein
MSTAFIIGLTSPLPLVSLSYAPITAAFSPLPRLANSGFLPQPGATGVLIPGEVSPLPQLPNSGFVPQVGAVAIGMHFGSPSVTYGYPT